MQEATNLLAPFALEMRLNFGLGDLPAQISGGEPGLHPPDEKQTFEQLVQIHI